MTSTPTTCPQCHAGLRASRAWAVTADIDIYDAGTHRGHVAPVIQLMDHGSVDLHGRIRWHHTGEVSDVECGPMALTDDEPHITSGDAPTALATSAEVMEADIHVFCEACDWVLGASE